MVDCIPVLFTRLKLPFTKHIDYSRFTVQLDLQHHQINSTNLTALLEPNMTKTEWISNARKYLKTVRQFLQYTWMYNKKNKLINPTFKYDAYGLTLAILGESLI